MGFIKESFRDWKYYASKENTGANRGFFRTMAIGFIVLAVVLFVAAIAGVLTGALKIVGFVFPVIVIVLLALFLFVTRDK